MQDLNIKQKRVWYVLVALVLVVCVQNIGIAAAKKIYWSEWGKIRRANLDGSNVEDVIKGLVYAKDVSLDFQNNTIFWIEEDIAKYKDVVLGYTKIMRANSDGTHIEEIIGGYHIPPEGGRAVKECNGEVCRAWIRPEGEDLVEIDPELYFLPWCISLDNQQQHIYWVDKANRRYQRANLDGTGIEDVKDMKITSTWDMKLNLKQGKLYWVELSTRRIRRMNLNGSDVEVIVDGWRHPILSIGLDVDARKIYWTSTSGGSIHRASLNGANIETVITGLREPNHLVVDEQSRKMYWSAWNRKEDRHKIQQANLDGSNVRDVVTNLHSINGLALDFEGIYAVDPAGKLTMTWADVKTD